MRHSGDDLDTRDDHAGELARWRPHHHPNGTRTTARDVAVSWGSRGPLVGVWTPMRFMLRRHRIKLPGWALGIRVPVVCLSAGLPIVYATDAAWPR